METIPQDSDAGESRRRELAMPEAEQRLIADLLLMRFRYEPGERATVEHVGR